MQKILLSLICIMTFMIVSAQDNFTFTPARPKPGDVIKISYKPAGDLTGMDNIEGIVYQYRKWPSANDLDLIKNGDRYEATIKTDSSVNFIQLAFRKNDIYDNNHNEGYYIQLWDGDMICRDGYASLGFYYFSGYRRSGIDGNEEKALEAFQKERSLYPEQPEEWEWNYYALVKKLRNDQYDDILRKEIGACIKRGIVTENDYNRLSWLYSNAGMDTERDSVSSLKKKKFPEGEWKKYELLDSLNAMTDSRKKIELAELIISKIQNDDDWRKFNQKSMIGSFYRNWTHLEDCRIIILREYGTNKQWDLMRKMKNESCDGVIYAETYNNFAWELQEKNLDLATASEISLWSVESAKKEIGSPSLQKPEMLSEKEWMSYRKSNYASFADTYAMIQYKLKDYQKGFPYANEAAISINKGKDPDQNYTWALLAEKVLPPRDCKLQLEQFVRDAKARFEVIDILKKQYIAENKSDSGFQRYVDDLEKDFKMKKCEEIRKTMISQTAPTFILNNLKNEEVNLENLKGKVVIIDFWATWCGPCKASMPFMQQELEKYKDQKDVVFLFIDSWELGNNDSKSKGAANFLSSNHYSFEVLMDNNNSVIKKYGVSGIPTKFIVDKDGMIRFKTVGFSDGPTLQAEVEAMIGMVR